MNSDMNQEEQDSDHGNEFTWAQFIKGGWASGRGLLQGAWLWSGCGGALGRGHCAEGLSDALTVGSAWLGLEEVSNLQDSSRTELSGPNSRVKPETASGPARRPCGPRWSCFYCCFPPPRCPPQRQPRSPTPTPRKAFRACSKEPELAQTDSCGRIQTWAPARAVLPAREVAAAAMRRGPLRGPAAGRPLAARPWVYPLLPSPPLVPSHTHQLL
ncbi:uncharacterized protein LOC128561974 [Nycticebus coucang]|uniref:uncharacterized protein LOC128561974 n=1 Tax=Nycticebus coucang TaxID=9470 RepID=UPI00234C0D87|nr:uncharacterized protein LOC128561974 [Nycticebus coucang]